jgi:hypothetical protein
MNLSRINVERITVPDVPGVTVKVCLSSEMDGRWQDCVASALNEDLQVAYRDIDDNFIVTAVKDERDVDRVVAQIDIAIGLANDRYPSDA